jgi:cell division protein FtsW (lipid II flippase)
MELEQILLPAVSLIFVIGLLMIDRLRGLDGVWQQLLRGFLPGLFLAGLLVSRPQLVERLRRWAVPISLVGLALPFLTAVFGVVDETGARLALKIGPLPAIQTSDLIKVALIIFLAWYIDREGAAAEGRARPVLGWLRMPKIHYLLPGVLFVVLATLSLVQMSDFGAALILAFLFIAMLYAGFETRTFLTIAAIGLVLAIVAGLILAATWDVPTVIQYRFQAFLNPWSREMILVNGQPAGVTISEGPGYQIQQAIYAIIAGGITGTGLGFGSPQYVPLAHSDFILAAILEEFGAVVGIALLLLFAVVLLRLFRTVMILPDSQVFERLLVVGIAVHLFTQVFLMAGGTLNLLPLTGVTIPFLSQGGMALMVNLAELGIVLAVLRRVEAIGQ